MIGGRLGAATLALIALVVLVASMAFRLSFVEAFDFHADEGQHLHFAWCISKGLVPYRDFFEHHAPWMHFAIAPLLRFYSVDSDADSALSFIFMLRKLMWVATGLILAAVFWLGKAWRGWRVGLIASALLVNEAVFLDKTMEIRPDVPSLLFMVASLAALVGALRSGQASSFVLSGVLMGGAVVCNLKVLFTGPPGLVVMVAYLAGAGAPGFRLRRLGNVALYLFAFGCPLLLTAAGFAQHGALRDLFTDTVLFSAGWKYRVPPYEWFLECLMTSPLAVALAVTGWLRCAAHMFRNDAVERGDYVFVVLFAGLLGGAFIMPAPWPQYHLLYLPLGALLAAACLVDLVALGERPRPWPRGQRLEVGVTLAVLGGLSWAALRLSPPALGDAWICSGAVLLAWPLTARGARDVALALLSLGLLAGPLRLLARWPLETNEFSLSQIRYIINNSAPTDTVLDGSTLHAPFRLHAYRYYFLNDEIRVMLPPTESRLFYLMVDDGRIAPRLLILDRHLRHYCPEALPLFERDYRPAGLGEIWIRKSGAAATPPRAR